jgi:hypothetical protein
MYIAGKAEFQPAAQSTRRKRQTDRSAPQGQERLVNVRPLFVSKPQLPELIQPSESPFDHPAPAPQPAAMLGVAFPKKREDASVTQALPD